MNKKEQMKLQRKLVTETFDWYTANPNRRRSVGQFTDCMYTTGSSKCAVGRCMTKSALYEIGDAIADIQEMYNHCTSDSEIINSIDKVLKMKYRGYTNKLLWEHLQDFHDGDFHWNTCDNTITKAGRDYIKDIRKGINKGIYTV